MARPQKIGLDYFPFDVDFFADRKIKVLFARFGAEGVAFYLYILCEIYRDKGFFVQCDDEFLEVASAELQMEREKLLRLLGFFVERQLIHGGLFREFGVLTSRGIQVRYQRAKENAGRKTPVPVRKELWLLSERETSVFIQVREGEVPVREAKRRTPGKSTAAKVQPPKREAGGEVFQGAVPMEEVQTGPQRLEEGKDGWKACEINENTGRSREEGDWANRTAEAEGNPTGGSFEGKELSSIREQCSSGENSGGNNPQRKQNKTKRKEKGEGAPMEGANQSPVSAPSSLASGAFQTPEIVGVGEVHQKSANQTPVSAPTSLASGAFQTPEIVGVGEVHQKSANQTPVSAPSSLASGAFHMGSEGAKDKDTSQLPVCVCLAELVRKMFAKVPPNLEQEIGGFVKAGAPEELLRYALEEARRKGKPYSYMAAIVRQRMAEGRLDTGGKEKPVPSYDLAAFEELGFHVPKVPKRYGGK